VREVTAIKANPDAIDLLRFEKACVQLCIIAFSKLPKGMLSAYSDRAAYVADRACSWYSEHMHESPSIPDAALAVNCSDSHFRRLFVQARACPPEAAFLEMRLSRALEYLRGGHASMKEIADACGYDSQSSFSRAFRQRFGVAPSQYNAGRGEIDR